jgi:tetratricopeptide (TPR) repeat protein
VRLFQEMGDPEASAVRALMAYPLCIRGPLSKALAITDETAEMALRYPEMGERLFGLSAPDYNLFWRAWLLARMGRFEDAGRAATRAVAAGRDRSVLELVAWALPVHSLVAYLTGEGKGAVGRASEAVGVADELGSPFHSVLALEGLGAASLAAGRGEDALRPLHEALTLARDRHVGLFDESSLLAYLADAHLHVGDEAAAVQAADEAVAVARQQAARVHECQALVARARALRSMAGLDAGKAIAADLTEASAAIEEVGAHAWSPFVHEERAQLAGLEGDVTIWERELREAHRLFAATMARGHAARLTKELA